MEEANATPEDVQRAEAVILPGFRQALEELLGQRQDPRPTPADEDAIFAIADRAVHEFHAATARDRSLPRLSRTQLLDLRHRLCTTHGDSGPLGPLLRLAGAEDIVVNGTRGGYVEYGDHREPLPVSYTSEEELERYIRWYAEHSGKHFDAGNPIVTITLRDGTRINAVRPPLAKPMQITIRL